MRQYLYFIAGVITASAVVPFAMPQAQYVAATAYTARSANSDSASLKEGRGTQRDENGMFYISGDVGPKSIRFLVDTGASHVILSHADAQKAAGDKAVGEMRTVMTAGGPVAVDWVVIKEIEFEGHILKNLKAAVPHRDVGLSLLGQNALAQFEAVHINGDRLTLSR